MRIFIIEDDPAMSECIKLAIQRHLSRSELSGHNLEIQSFSDAIEAIQNLNQALPDLIMLDILPNGPNCFTLLNELSSYSDTASIPIILLSSLELHQANFQQYPIASILQKDTMRPEDIGAAVLEACAHAA